MLADVVELEAAAGVGPQPALRPVEPGAVLVPARQVPEGHRHLQSRTSQAHFHLGRTILDYSIKLFELSWQLFCTKLAVMMDEKFSLKWNDFQTNVSNSFRKLRSNDSFYDVTLVSDDQQQVSAHKVVLASSSEYFKNILTSNKHSHPMLCLSGVNTADLKNVLDYVYNGEIQIYQNNLDHFLEIAQRFQLEGLLRGPDEDIGGNRAEAEEFEQNNFKETDDNMLSQIKSADFENEVVKVQKEKIISIQSLQFENIEELDLKIEEMMERQSDGKYLCLTCGKLARKVHLKEHVEIHIDGLSFPCQFCDKSFRLRNTFRRHKCSHLQ